MRLSRLRLLAIPITSGKLVARSLRLVKPKTADHFQPDNRSGGVDLKELEVRGINTNETLKSIFAPVSLTTRYRFSKTGEIVICGVAFAGAVVVALLSNALAQIEHDAAVKIVGIMVASIFTGSAIGAVIARRLPVWVRLGLRVDRPNGR